jgi:hypothetical protein
VQRSARTCSHHIRSISTRRQRQASAARGRGDERLTSERCSCTRNPRHGGRRRPQLNALLESWEDVARFRAVAYVRRADLREVLIPALKLYVKALTPAERRAIDVETKRIAATLATSD